jgi:hypothetical protein
MDWQSHQKQSCAAAWHEHSRRSAYCEHSSRQFANKSSAPRGEVARKTINIIMVIHEIWRTRHAAWPFRQNHDKNIYVYKLLKNSYLILFNIYKILNFIYNNN